MNFKIHVLCVKILLKFCRDGAVVRVLAFHPCGPGSIPRFGVIIMWVEFVGSLFCTERFSAGTPVSPLLKKKTNILI